MSNLFSILSISGILLLGLLTVGIVIARLYQRASKEISFVRTGFGGQKVIMNGGAFVLPILHEIIPVNMNTLRLVVSRQHQQALITKDRMRVDVTAEFYLRVKPDESAIAFAAQTLGRRTMSPEDLKELMEGKFVDSLRAVAAEMAMEELHEKRTDFVQKVQNAVTGDLEKNGLELETVSLTGLDQTDKQFFNPDNAFDAQGLTRLTETIESKRKIRNDIEQNTSVEIRKKNIEAEKQRLEIEKEEEFAKATQQREIANQAAHEASETAKVKAENERISQEADILAQQQIEVAKEKARRQVTEEKILNDQAVKQKDIERQRAIEIANQDRDIAISDKSKEKSRSEKEAKEAEADAVAARERVLTAQETEIANRNKQIAVIKAMETAEQDAVEIKVAAEAKKAAAADEADAITISAQAEADAVLIRAKADEERFRVEAEAQVKLNSAENTLSPEIIRMRIQLETIKNAAGIIEASVKPIESIEGMKIINIGGMENITGGNGGGHASCANGNMGDQLINSLLKYRGLAPVVDSILKEVGLSGGNIENLTDVVRTGMLETAESKEEFTESAKKETPEAIKN